MTPPTKSLALRAGEQQATRIGFREFVLSNSNSARTNARRSTLIWSKQMTNYLTDDDEGPEYNIDSAALTKWRRLARKGLSKLTAEQRLGYSAAVEAAVLSAQRSALRRAGVPEMRPNCASGTWHNTGEAIHKAVRQRLNAALLACPSQERRARKPEKWREMYDAAMKERREREAAQPAPMLTGRAKRVAELLARSQARLQEVA
jgi:hypothetical protein